MPYPPIRLTNPMPKHMNLHFPFVPFYVNLYEFQDKKVLHVQLYI